MERSAGIAGDDDDDDDAEVSLFTPPGPDSSFLTRIGTADAEVISPPIASVAGVITR